MLSDRDFTRRLLQTVLTVAGVAIVLFALWAAREALLLIYVSALIAMGFSPLPWGSLPAALAFDVPSGTSPWSYSPRVR